LEAATIVFSFQCQTIGLETEEQKSYARQKIARDINNLIYQQAFWDAGLLIPSVARLAVVRALLKRHTEVFTTNYDELIEEEIARIISDGKTIPLIAHQLEERGANRSGPESDLKPAIRYLSFDGSESVSSISGDDAPAI